MRNILFGLALLCSSSTVVAEMKIGAVDPAKVLEQAPQAEVARTLLEKEFAGRDRELVELQQKYRALEEVIARDGLMMSPEQRDGKDRELRTMQRDVRRTQEAFRDDLNIRRNEEFGKLQREIYEAIIKLAERDGYDLILSEGVIYASDKIDLSDQLIEQLKQQYSQSTATP
ncbi:hypothetical protein MNBD_GAMMA18-1098 [hydrothermal vent metagenome]|uniref:OmpH family outer membrane protein n=1 Tax=hydrothermal vent metagenome TaxID=652676 RepID=A0A3B0ZKB2_9ZZZZ